MIDRLVIDAHDSFDWVKERVGVDGWLGPVHSFSVIRDGVMVAAVVFDGFTKHDCNLHLAADVPDPPMFWIRALFRYPFHELGLKRITGLIRDGNVNGMAVAERNGFKLEGRKRLGAGDADELVYGLVAADCEHLMNYKVRDCI